ncbi:MAG: secretin N-terminal domain-containing protein, partial [Planctomycetota bacterium]
MRVYPTSVFILSVAATATLTFGQGRPQPQAPPTPQAIQEMFPDGLTNDDEGNVIEGARRPGDTNPNRLQTIDENELVPLSMSDVDVKDLFGWLAENTGKVVIPIDLPALNIKKIQIRSAQPVPRWKALDLVIEAMRLNKIGIIEKEDILIIGDATQIQGQARTPLLGPDVDISTRIDTGTVVIKVFQVEQVDVEALNESLQDFVPDTATLTVDPNSNKILVHGDLGLCQQIDRMITQLDVNYVKEVTRTFRLKYADASEIADNISELFQEDGASANRNTGVRRTNTNNQRGRQTANAATAGPPGPQVELVQTVNINTNSVTVKADKSRIQKIEELITYQWDLPRPAGTSRVYVLEHTDPVVMRDTLQTVLGQGGTSRPGATRTATGGGGGQRADVSQIVSGIYRIEAYPDKNALVVLCKTEESFDFLDGLISELDQPSTVGLPVVVPLKHANAIELTEELNVLLADAGGGSLALERPETGLSMENVSSLSEGSGDSGSTTESGQINFPWASNRGQNAADATANSPSSLIGKVRIVPIVR